MQREPQRLHLRDGREGESHRDGAFVGSGALQNGAWIVSHEPERSRTLG